MTYTNDKLITWEDCLSCGERKTTIGCGCDRNKANEEAREVFRDILNDNGMISLEGFRL